MLWNVVREYSALQYIHNIVSGAGDIPQPNMGEPGTGDFTLTFFGDAGVVGRAAMVRRVRPVRCLHRGE